jgi:hypothetical protein
MTYGIRPRELPPSRIRKEPAPREGGSRPPIGRIDFKEEIGRRLAALCGANE